MRRVDCGHAESATTTAEGRAQLPDDQRAGLVAELLDSLAPAVPSEGRSEAEWIAEVQRRARAAMAGQPGIPWDQALAQVRERCRHE